MPFNDIYDVLHMKSSPSLRCLLVQVVLSTSLLAYSGHAFSTSGEEIITYTAPKLVKGSVVVAYPVLDRINCKEAWVDLSFMVDTKGQVFDIQVVDNSGDDAFVKQAVTAVEKARYLPASQNGKPIEARRELRVRFQMEGSQKGAYPKFVRRFRSLTAALKRGDLEKASRVMSRLNAMDIRNLYEDAYLNIARFNYAAAMNQSFETQLRFLSRALDGQGQEQYIPEELYQSSLKVKFKLEIQTKDYTSALSSYRRLLKSVDAGDLPPEFGELYKHVRDVRTSKGSYRVAGEVLQSGIYRIGLYKERFSLHDVIGDITDMKLQCSAYQVELPFQIDTEFKVPASYGACTLFIYGSAGSTFALQQTTV